MNSFQEFRRTDSAKFQPLVVEVRTSKRRIETELENQESYMKGKGRVELAMHVHINPFRCYSS